MNRFEINALHRLLKLRECDNRAHAPAAYERFVTSTIPFSNIPEEEIRENNAFKTENLSINGNNLIQIGFEQGPSVGATLNYLLNEVIEDKIFNDRASLLECAKALLNNIDSKKGD